MTLGKGTWVDDEDDEHVRREYGFWFGVVTNHVDPQRRGRIKAHIPGLVEETTWAEQSSLGGGGDRHGGSIVPKVGSTVIIGFIQGDIDVPFYIGGPPPVLGQPTGMLPDNIVFQSDSFRVVLQEAAVENNNSAKLRLESILSDARYPDLTDLQRDNLKTVIEIDITAGDGGTAHAINITAPSAITIRAEGAIDIDAATVTIKGRAVLASDRPI